VRCACGYCGRLVLASAPFTSRYSVRARLAAAFGLLASSARWNAAPILSQHRPHAHVENRIRTAKATVCGTCPSKIAVLGCGDCGEVGCWPLYTNVQATNDTVAWFDFEQPHRRQRDYSGFGPFLFSRDTYEQAVEEVVTAIRAADHNR
jgi:hypothetical protein